MNHLGKGIDRASSVPDAVITACSAALKKPAGVDWQAQKAALAGRRADVGAKVSAAESALRAGAAGVVDVTNAPAPLRTTYEEALAEWDRLIAALSAVDIYLPIQYDPHGDPVPPEIFEEGSIESLCAAAERTGPGGAGRRNAERARIIKDKEEGLLSLESVATEML
jgi:hypothetical protein